ncbi:MAG: ABC transporter ATP-binding protein [Planctomycetes bacterium]|nr:ABC transporter ATP-binding protein [Planctomycetota bacterium]
MTPNASVPSSPSQTGDAPPIVEVRGVSKVYHRGPVEISVLRGLDLSLPRGVFAAFMGPSGSGKTTLLNLVGGLDVPSAGAVSVAGEILAALRPRALAAWRAAHVGFIVQLYNLIPVLTAADNVELPLLLTHLNRKQRAEHVRTALEVVGLSDRAGHYPRQLSGGQEQRVAIARAIVTDPTIVVADEPTGDLDAESAAEVLTLLRRLNQEFGKTILMVTHDPHAAEVAGRVYRLDKGRLASER